MNNQLNLHAVQIFIILLLPGFLLTACLGNNTRPASYYLLTADKSHDVVLSATDDKPAILIRAVTIPDYLARKQIVSRNSAHGLMVSDQHRWGGKFRKNIERVLANNLSYYLSSANVAVSPHSQPIDPTYFLEVSINEFERLENGRVILSADWYLVDPESLKSVRFAKESISSENTVAENDYNAIVGSMSNALDVLGHKIAYAVSQQAN